MQSKSIGKMFLIISQLEDSNQKSSSSLYASNEQKIGIYYEIIEDMSKQWKYFEFILKLKEKGDLNYDFGNIIPVFKFHDNSTTQLLLH